MSENKVKETKIEEMINNAKYEDAVFHDKIYVLSCKLPNGFVITESSGAVDPENFDRDLSRDICVNKIVNRLWELEGYLLQNELIK